MTTKTDVAQECAEETISGFPAVVIREGANGKPLTTYDYWHVYDLLKFIEIEHAKHFPPSVPSRPLIYLAGPYTSPNANVNTHKALQMANFLWDSGFCPFVPHLCHFWDTMTPKPYNTWIEYDNVFLTVCQGLFRMEGASAGSDAEVALATKLSIPVFYKITDLFGFFPGRKHEKV